MTKESFIFYFQWGRSIRELDRDVQLEVFNAIMQLAETGRTGKLSPIAHAVMAFIKPTIDKDKSKYERMCSRNRNNRSGYEDDEDYAIEDEDNYDYLAEENDDDVQVNYSNETSHRSNSKKVSRKSPRKSNRVQASQKSDNKRDNKNSSSNAVKEHSTPDVEPGRVTEADSDGSQSPDILIFDDKNHPSGSGASGCPVEASTASEVVEKSTGKSSPLVTTGQTFAVSSPLVTTGQTFDVSSRLGSDNDNEYDNDYDNETSKEYGSLSAPKGYERFTFDFVQPHYRAPFFEWLAYKRERHERYTTQRTLKACYGNLVKLSGGDPDVARQVVEQSEANNWAGLFMLKNSDNNGDKRSNNTVGAQQAVRAGQDAFGRVMQRISSRQHPCPGAAGVLAGGAAAAMP